MDTGLIINRNAGLNWPLHQRCLHFPAWFIVSFSPFLFTVCCEVWLRSLKSTVAVNLCSFGLQSKSLWIGSKRPAIWPWENLKHVPCVAALVFQYLFKLLWRQKQWKALESCAVGGYHASDVKSFKYPSIHRKQSKQPGQAACPQFHKWSNFYCVRVCVYLSIYLYIYLSIYIYIYIYIDI